MRTANPFDRWFDMREFKPDHCYACDSKTEVAGMPCPACRPLSARLHEPITPSTAKADRGLDNSPLARARWLIANPASVESHAACRALIGDLVAMVDEARSA